jgi:uncharacterized protein YneF (UPF0154 family)
MEGIKLTWWQLVIIFTLFIGFFIGADAQQGKTIDTKLDKEIFIKHEKQNLEDRKMFVKKFDDAQKERFESEKKIIEILTRMENSRG